MSLFKIHTKPNNSTNYFFNIFTKWLALAILWTRFSLHKIQPPTIKVKENRNLYNFALVTIISRLQKYLMKNKI